MYPGIVYFEVCICSLVHVLAGAFVDIAISMQCCCTRLHLVLYDTALN